MTTPADHDKRCPAAWDTSVKCNCGAQAADEIALIEKTLKSVGITSLLNHGAASCVFTEGCCGVSQEHILAYTRKIALHCAVALAAPPTAQAEGWRDIATAPKDGVFLVYMQDEVRPARRMQVADWHSNVKIVGGLFSFDCATVTHWMPLPPPPTSAEGVEHG